MLKIVTWLLLAVAAVPFRSLGANYVYIVDTSRSMGAHQKEVSEALTTDIQRALESRSFVKGDRLRVWTFTSKVSELLSADYKPGADADIIHQLRSKLKRVKMEGLTTMTRPLFKALEDFGSREMGELHLFIYTDGRDWSVSPAESEKILRQYNYVYKQDGRLRQAALIQFGKQELPAATRKLIEDIGGTIITNGHAPNPTPAVKLAQAAPATNQTTISVSPTSIRIAGRIGSEVVKPALLEFTVAPPRPGLLVVLALEVPDLPAGMSINTVNDRLAAEGRQSVVFQIKNAAAGTYPGKLKLSASVPVSPAEIPVEIEIASPRPDQIGLQFYPEQVPSIELPPNDQWQNIPNVGLTLFYSQALDQTLIRFEHEIPQGVELRVVPGRDPAQTVAMGRPVKVGDVGRTAAFQIRHVPGNSAGTNFTAKLRVHVETGQPVQSVGTNTVQIPFHVSRPVAVQVETTEIDLGTIPPATKTIRGTLAIRVQGHADGRKLRVLKQADGLSGITVSPNEITLKSGMSSVDLDFSGFEGRAPGAIGGTLIIAPVDDLLVRASPISVRARIPEPAKIIADVENPMVAGQPLVIHARFDTGEKATITSVVMSPDGKKSEITLADAGSSEDGDQKANDGIYSGLFRQTETLGRYQITISSRTTSKFAENISLSAPIYFKAPSKPLVGSTAKRKQSELIKFKSIVVSEFPGTVGIQEEPAKMKHALATYISGSKADKTLERGENALDLSIEIAPETQPGEYKYQLNLITDPVDGVKAKIPITFEVKVLSLFHYLIRLVAIALALAVAAFVMISAPWKKKKSLGRIKGLRQTNDPRNDSENSLAER